MFKNRTLISVLLILSLSLGFPALAAGEPSETNEQQADREIITPSITVNTETGEETVTQQELPTEGSSSLGDITLEPMDPPDGGEVSLMGTFTNPKEAFLKVNTNCYAAPSPNNGYLLQTLPANTTVWVVEKKYSSDNNRYYYYAGYNYNGASHRGYFCEDNVYTSANTRLTHSNVEPEKAPANYKVHTSKAGDVYDGPATTYSKMGSVGAESIKLIRTQGNFNFIEYTVAGTGKLKRGFLNYTLISGSWGTLTAKNRGLDGKVMYIANTSSSNEKKYLTISSSANNTYATMEEFTGDYGQLFKFTYMDDNDTIGPYFYIQPVIGYDYDGDSDNENRRLAIQSSSSLEHDGRKLRNYNFATNRYQKFWVVKTSTPSGYYKIVPVSSYGTMDWSASLYTSTGLQVVQTYTNDPWVTETGYGYHTNDLWQFETSSKQTTAQWVWQEGEPWCWAAAAKIIASCEDPQYYNSSLSYIVGSLINDGENNGYQCASARAANYFKCGTFDDTYFRWLSEPKILSETTIRKLIDDDHAIWIELEADTFSHAVAVVGFWWDDTFGEYQYQYYDPNNNPEVYGPSITTYDILTSDSFYVQDEASYWQHTVAYKTAYWVIGDPLPT